MSIPLTLSEKRAESALRKLSVLVVDGNETIRELVTKVLGHLGFKMIDQATDGFEAIKIMQSKRIDLIVTDWELSFSATGEKPSPFPKEKEEEEESSDSLEMDWGEFPPDNGANFVKHIRSNVRSPNRFVPIIMLTGPTKPDAVIYARDSGVNEVLMKPLDSRNLCNRIINIIEKPRPFVTGTGYQGPCRRRKEMGWGGREERRTHRIEIIKFQDHKGMSE